MQGDGTAVAMRPAASPEGGCMWDACEALLKASLAPKEDVLLRAWVRGWTQNMPCFPRLHVITAQEHIHRARVHFRGVPNVTFRENAFPPRVANSSYLLIQIHILWADNFTTAPYVLYFDTDAVPVLPLRCHHLWDDDDRLLMHAWNRAPNRTTAWVSTVSQLLLRAEPLHAAAAGAPFTPSLQNNDYMSFWPIVAPRSLLPHVRRIVARAYGTYFDDAFALMPAPSHADLIGKVAPKVALLLRPHATHQAPCPALRSEYR